MFSLTLIKNIKNENRAHLFVIRNMVKKLLSLTWVVMAMNAALAQETSPVCEDQNQNFSNQTHWNGMDLYVPWLGDADGNNANISPWLEQNMNKSAGIRINFIEKKFPFTKNGSGIYTGLGYSFESYAWKKNIELRYSDATATNMLTYSYQPDNDFENNELRLSKLTVPMMLELNFGSANKPQFHVAAGLLGHWRFGIKSYQSYHNQFGDFLVKNKTDFGIRSFASDFSASIGYGRTKVFVTVPMQTFFKTNVTNPIYNFSAGFTVMSFDSNERIEKKKDEIIKRWKI